MEKIISTLMILITVQGFAQFDRYFEDKTMRMDYYHSGNKTAHFYTFDELIEEPYWGGSKVNLIDTFNYSTRLRMI